VEKTALMQFGTNDRITADILALGFEVTNSITVLGLEITGDTLDFSNSWNKITGTIRGQIGLWRRFNLSLPGSINIAKSMLYSQINYLACFLPVPDNFIDQWKNLIETFVLGNERVGEKRFYLTTSEGGLGLFDLKTYIHSQKIAWISRANNLDEVWKVRLFIAGYSNLSNVRCCFLDKTSTPILFEIANSYQIFLEGFTRDNENFWESKLLENNALFLRLRDKLPLKIGFFKQDFFTNNKEKILNLRITDFFLTKDSYKPFEVFKTSTGLNIDRDRFDNLKKLASNAKMKYTKQEPIETKTKDILSYLMRGTKGCKRYRKKIIGKLEKYILYLTTL